MQFQRLTPNEIENYPALVARLRGEIAQVGTQHEARLRKQSHLGMMMLASPATFDEGFNLLEVVRAALSKLHTSDFSVRHDLRWATALQYSGRHLDAILVFENALEAIELLGFQTRDFALQHLGKCLVEIGQWDRARDSFNEALDLRISRGDTELETSSCRALSGLEALEVASATFGRSTYDPILSPSQKRRDRMADVHVFAKIKPKPEHYTDVLVTLQEIVVATKDESGCKRFELNTGIDEDRCIYLVEIWESVAALEEHHKMPYTVAAAERIDGKLLANTEVIKMVPTS